LSKFGDGTRMGGENRRFPVTKWSKIINLKTSDDSRKDLIINELLKRYWKPIYCYLRRQGYDNETAKDITQGFFQEVVLGRELIQKADQIKGHFRTFLLTAIDRYIIDLHRYETTSKRKPHGQMFQLSNVDLSSVPLATTDTTPEQSFHLAWISNLLDQVLCEVKNEFFSNNNKIHWQVFDEKILKPIITSSDSPSLKDICAKYGIDNDKRVSNMIITVKRRLRKSLERCLRQFAHSDAQLKQEILEMLEVFTKK
jgi:RNA polymerase sigma-70 factor (ECF subfamily)